MKSIFANRSSLFMRTFVLVLFMTCTFQWGFAQINLKLSNPTLGKVIEQIQSQTKYKFFYDDKLAATKVDNVNFKDASVTKVLDTVLKGKGISYKLEDKVIYLSVSKEQQKIQAGKMRKLTGKVVDESGEPLIGVNVLVKGTTTGTVTNLDGEFVLNTDVKHPVLSLTYIGYKPLEVNAKDDVTFNLVMQSDTQLIGEVVVTALGIKRSEKALSYNVQKVENNELTTVKDANFVNSLNGKVAGLSIQRSSAGIGGATKVVMRGAKSIEGDNNVLYVIDGVPIFNYSGGLDSGIMGEGKVGSEGIADFNPEDIESISVLSGPSAAALYGSNAANGAILITTKKGAEGKTKVTISSSSEFSSPFIMPEFQNTYGNKGGRYDSWGSKLSEPCKYNPKKDFFKTGVNLINSVTISTGNKNNQTFASVASTNSTGIVPNNSYDRLNFTVRNTSNLFSDKLKMDLGASYIKQKDKNMVSQGQYFNPVMAAYLYPRGENFDKIKNFERYNVERNLPTQYWPIADGVFANQNPYWVAYRNLLGDKKDRYMLNAGLTYMIFDWLNVAARVRYDKSFVTNERKFYASTYEVFAKPKGFYEYSNYNDHQTYSDFIVNINKHISNWSIAANIGLSYSDFASITRGYGGNLSLVPNLFAIQNISPSAGEITELGGDSKVRNFALFGSVELGWKSMLYLTLTGRNDWNSRLVNSSEESFFYPSVGLSAILSEMFKLPEAISYLKARGSFTEVGAPITRSGMTPGTITTPIVGGVLKPTGIYPYGDFKAERTRSYEFGVTARLWNKIHVDATWYKSNTFNQTFLGNLPESSGYKSVYLQAGDVQNTGWELSLGYDDKFGDWRISSTLTYTSNKNKIKEMVDNYNHPLNPDPITISEVVKDNGRVILKKGGTINDIYASKFFHKDNQGYININESGQLSLDNTDPVYLGKTTPDFTMGWNNGLSYKNFHLNFLINARVGGVVTSSTQAIMDKFGVSKVTAVARDNGGVVLKNQGDNAVYDAKKYYQIIGTGGSELAGY